MASRANRLEGASAPSNVVRLPTAAPRQVKQHHNKATRAARAELPQFPDRFIFPTIRAQLPKARLLADNPPSPEMALASCLFSAMDDGTKARATTMLKILALKCPSIAAVALAYIEPSTNGQQSSLEQARRLIDEGRA